MTLANGLCDLRETILAEDHHDWRRRAVHFLNHTLAHQHADPHIPAVRKFSFVLLIE
jgi:hypothetical protein